ncbi:hypothetical protein SCLCIDRAFT_339658 [Scleroderma citrinum Foug A]|uniref:Uncharacterized protein n=1 Tax=Scleroderma citrinum Foug A TaxID=1036808 RepID=A0A0C2YZ14_9AGAM|nr:hypothetical protein SCLCIDRAFT_339658 [Scleroderma citrinum Foug A]
MEIGEIFTGTTLDASDGHSPLRRIMADAQAGTSKYSLYLSVVQNSIQEWSYDEALGYHRFGQTTSSDTPL